MANITMDLRGLKCPQPTLKLSAELMSKKLNPGDVVEVSANCSTFEDDVRKWCTKMNKTLVWIREESDGSKKCQVLI